jgi:hypothetical protein
MGVFGSNISKYGVVKPGGEQRSVAGLIENQFFTKHPQIWRVLGAMFWP